MRVLGATEEQIDAQVGPQAKHFEVWPENWAALQAFLAVQTQWSVGMNGPTGLDYECVRAGWKMAGVDVTPELFQKVRILETAFLGGLAKRAKGR